MDTDNDFQRVWRSFETKNSLDPTTFIGQFSNDDLANKTGEAVSTMGVGLVQAYDLVNPGGYPVRLGKDQRTYYCGRYLGTRDRLRDFSDGRCGPNNGPQCQDCLAFRPMNPRGFFLRNLKGKWFCGIETSEGVCSEGSSFQCGSCLSFVRNPSVSMATGLSYRLAADKTITNSKIQAVKFEEEGMRSPYCSSTKLSRFYGIQKCCGSGKMSCRDCQEGIVLLNSAGYPVSNGTDFGCLNKFYCGRYLRTLCPSALPRTDGYCGPNNGPQCQDCLDFQEDPWGAEKKGFQSLFILLRHKNPLVNPAGSIMTIGTECWGRDGGNLKFYCGRNLGVEAIPLTDGRCGPNNGNQCQDCHSFNFHNPAGFHPKPDKHGGHFYCGRKRGSTFPSLSVKKCGPREGPQCQECQNFQRNPGLEMRKWLETASSSL